MDRGVIEQPRRAGVRTLRNGVKRLSERFPVERIEEEDDEVAAGVGRDARVAPNQAQVATAQRVRLCALDIFAGYFIERGRDLDTGHLTERILRGKDHRAAHAGSHVDERGSLHGALRQRRDQLVKLADRHRFVMRRVRAGVAGGIGIEIGEEEHGVRGNPIPVIESPATAASARHA